MDAGSNLVEFPVQMKRCTGCANVKSLNDFTRDRAAKDGRAWRCRDCANSKYQKIDQKIIQARKSKYLRDSKECTICQVQKLLHDFPKQAYGDGHTGQCKECNSVLQRNRGKQRYQKNKLAPKNVPEKLKCCKCKLNKNSSEFHNSSSRKTGKSAQCSSCSKLRHDKQEQRKNSLKRNYGIDYQVFQSIVIAQNNQCAICHTNLDGSTKGLTPHMDHCHATKKIRGVLCAQCNFALGHFKDNKKLLLSAVQYLEKYSEI